MQLSKCCDLCLSQGEHQIQSKYILGAWKLLVMQKRQWLAASIRIFASFACPCIFSSPVSGPFTALVAEFSGLQNRCWVRWEAPKCERSCCNGNKCRYLGNLGKWGDANGFWYKIHQNPTPALTLLMPMCEACRPSGLYPDLSEMHGMHGMRCPKWKARIASFIRGSLKGGRCQR